MKGNLVVWRRRFAVLFVTMGVSFSPDASMQVAADGTKEIAQSVPVDIFDSGGYTSDFRKFSADYSTDALKDISWKSPQEFSAKVLKKLKPQFSNIGISLNRGENPAVSHSSSKGKSEWAIVSYTASHHDIPLAFGSDVMVIGKSKGGGVVRKRQMPHKFDATKATVDAQTALKIARQIFVSVSKVQDIQASPPKLEFWVNDDGVGQLAWKVFVESKSQQKILAFGYWIKATGTPEILHQRKLTLSASVSGTVKGKVWGVSPLKPTINVTFPFMKVREVGGTGGRTRTNSKGVFKLLSHSKKVAKVEASLEGPNIKIIPQGGGQILKNSSFVNPKGMTEINFTNSDEKSLAQTSAFYWTNVGQLFISKYFKGFEFIRDFEINVNMKSGECNAFYSPVSRNISFFQKSKKCANTAYAPIILHELGHAIDDEFGKGIDGGYGEGFGDALSILVLRTSCLAKDFFINKPGKCERNATRKVMWPPENPENVHHVGSIYSGFTWKLIENLRNKYSGNDDKAYYVASILILGAAVSNPSDIPDAVKLSFIIDQFLDDDGDPNNKTTHYDEIASAARSRGIPIPKLEGPKNVQPVQKKSSPSSLNIMGSESNSSNDGGGKPAGLEQESNSPIGGGWK